MKNFNSLQKDVIKYLFKNNNINDIYNLSLINRDLSKIFDNIFWMNKLYNDFEKYGYTLNNFEKPSDKNWKIYYKKIKNKTKDDNVICLILDIQCLLVRFCSNVDNIDLFTINIDDNCNNLKNTINDIFGHNLSKQLHNDLTKFKSSSKYSNINEYLTTLTVKYLSDKFTNIEQVNLHAINNIKQLKSLKH